MKLNILFVSPSYYPKISGVPNVVKYLAEGLCGLGHKVTVVTSSENKFKCEEVINNVNIKRFNLCQSAITKTYGGEIDNYISFIREGHYDIIILECVQCVTSDVLLPVLLTLGSKIILHAHGFSGIGWKLFKWRGDIKHTLGGFINWYKFRRMYNYILPDALNDIDATISLSRADTSYEYLELYSKKHIVLGNAADNMFFEHIQGNYTLDKYVRLKNKKYLVSCAYYSHIKNQLGIIKEYFKSSIQDVSLLLIGSQENEYYRKCLTLVADLSEKYPNKEVVLLTGVDRGDLPSIINHSEMYLVGSITEQFSVSIIEAMSQGVPFVSTNVGNARLLPGGMVVNSITEMHMLIEKILTDPGLRSRLSKEGKDYSYKYCRVPVVVKELESLLFSVIDN